MSRDEASLDLHSPALSSPPVPILHVYLYSPGGSFLPTIPVDSLTLLFVRQCRLGFHEMEC